ncbi:MAG: DUF4157 domain-containing protein [Clostridia bacterium]|nr:DUF4157 domain-containing protein [Clostridia bacterium]
MPDIHPFEKISTKPSSGFGTMLENEGAEKEADAVAERFANSRDVLGDMGKAYGRNLSHIRFHKDDSAAAKVNASGKVAVAKGNDIFFGKGVLDSPKGSLVAAHEVAHTMQQSGGYGMSHNVAFDSAQGFSWKGMGLGLWKGLKGLGGGLLRGARRAVELPATALGALGGVFGGSRLTYDKGMKDYAKHNRQGYTAPEAVGGLQPEYIVDGDAAAKYEVDHTAFSTSSLFDSTPGADGGFTQLFKGTGSIVPNYVNQNNPLARGAHWGKAIRNGLFEATMIPSLVRAVNGFTESGISTSQRFGNFFKGFSKWTPIDLIRGLGHGAKRLFKGIGNKFTHLKSMGIQTDYDIAHRAMRDYTSRGYTGAEEPTIEEEERGMNYSESAEREYIEHTNLDELEEDDED